MSGKPQSKVSRVANPAVEDVDDDAQMALDEAAQLQGELDSLSEKCAEEILQVEQKFNKLRKPFLEMRSEILKRIPEFWVTTLLNHPQLSEVISETDEQVLQGLESIHVAEEEDVKSGFKISFYFSENDFFENSVITKEFMVDPETSEPMSVGSDILWKEGKDITNRVIIVEQGRKRNHEDAESFFTWFNDNSAASNDPVAEIIKDDLWPNPVNYFLNTETSVDAEGYDDDQDLEDEDYGLAVLDEEDGDDADDNE